MSQSVVIIRGRKCTVRTSLVQYRKRVMKMCLLMYCLPISQHTHTHTRAPTPTYTHSHPHIYIHIHTYIYIHAHTHIYIYTHTHNLAHLKTIFSLIRTSKMYMHMYVWEDKAKLFEFLLVKRQYGLVTSGQETGWEGDPGYTSWWWSHSERWKGNGTRGRDGHRNYTVKKIRVVFQSVTYT